MITAAMSTAIGAGRERVWRALTTPDELVRWDERLVELLGPADGYPKIGRRVRWRYRMGAVATVLEDHPLEVVEPERLRSAFALGLFRFEATLTLGEEPGEPRRTRLGLKLVASNSIPVVGGDLLDRFAVRRLAVELVDARLRGVQKWCENAGTLFTS